jgi:hypothetical protein
VFDEVPEHHVPPARREPTRGEVLRGELPGEPVEQPAQGVEGVEHLPVARGVRAAALDDVAAVEAVLARGVQERLPGGQRVLETAPELVGVLAGEKQFVAVDGDGDPVAAALGGEATRARGFLDQPRRCGFLYPRRPESSWSDSASYSGIATTPT